MSPLIIAQRALLEKQRSQARLFGVIAHELTTPAAAIDMMVRQDLAELEDSERSLRHSQLINTSAHLLNVIDDFRVAINPEEEVAVKQHPFHLGQLFDEIVAHAQPLFKHSNFSLHYDKRTEPSSPQWYLGDAYRLRSICSNLLRNACLHSGGSRAWFSVHVTPYAKSECATLTFQIEDDGRGIKQDEVDRLFEPFERGDSTEPGTGVGLFIVKRWTELLGGQVTYQPSRHGGAQFMVNLTLAMTDPAVPVEGAPSGGGQLCEHTEECKVLLVKDDPLLRKLTERQLRKEFGFHITTADNGGNAVSQMIDGHFDLVITDYLMPQMDGRDLIPIIKGRQLELPVIAVTAATLGAEHEELIDAGANAVLGKPLDSSALRAVLANL